MPGIGLFFFLGTRLAFPFSSAARVEGRNRVGRVCERTLENTVFSALNLPCFAPPVPPEDVDSEVSMSFIGASFISYSPDILYVREEPTHGS